MLSASIFCGCTDNTAIENNDMFVLYKEKAEEDFISMNKYLNIAIQEKEYEIIDYIIATAIDSLNAKIESLEKLNIPPSAEKFRVETISYTQSLVNASEVYKSYSILSDSLTTIRQIDSIRTVIKRTEVAIDSTLNVLIASQEDFARIKKLRLETKTNK